MSTDAKTTPVRAGKETMATANEPSGYLSALAGGKSPISMPPIPAWMLNTQMYSKLPMLPAPRGKITLYTTGLGEKLYPTPNDLDFDPSAEGLSSQYKCLHDFHLKSHYTQPAIFNRLIKKKFITPEGKVICTLKEFNDYHQYLKRVNIEKLAQDRKKIASRERHDRERQRREWSQKEEPSPHDKQVLETQTRKRKMLREQHRRLCQRMEEDALRQVHLLEEKETKRSLERVKQSLEREKKRNKKLRMELEEHNKRMSKRRRISDDESRHVDMLKCYRMSVRDGRQIKLEDHWNRYQKIREKHRMESIRRQEELRASIACNLDKRVASITSQWSKQLSTFESIRDSRAIRIQRREAKIQARLERKLKAVRKLFEQRQRKPTGERRRRTPRHGLGGPRHYSNWPVEHALDRIELSPADGVWKTIDDKEPMPAPKPSPPLTKITEPSVTKSTEKLPEIERVSKVVLEEAREDEGVVCIPERREYPLSSVQVTLLFGDRYDSYLTAARDLVGNIFVALEIEKHSRHAIAIEPEVMDSEAITPRETKLPEIMRRTSVLELSKDTVARLVLSNVFRRAREQIEAEGGLPHSPSPVSTRAVASDTTVAAATPKPSIIKQISMRELHVTSPVPKKTESEGYLKPAKEPSPQHTSSLLATAVVSDVLKKVTQELREETQRSDTSVLADDLVWNTIRNVTDQLHKELSENVSRELQREELRSDTSILAEDVVRDAIRNVTSQLQKELSDSGTSLIAERVVTDAIRNAVRHLREMPTQQSGSSLLAEQLATTAIRDATRQLQVLLPQSSSSIIAEAIAADAMKNVMRQLGAQPPQSSSSILAQAYAADALKNATTRLEREQIVRALQPPARTSSSLLAQAITNDTLQKVTRQLQREREDLQPHTSSSLLAQAVTNDALGNALRQLERRSPSLDTDSSLLAQVITREVLQNASVRLQVERILKTPKTSSSMLAQDITVDALKIAAAQVTAEKTPPPMTSSSRVAQLTADEALRTAKEQLWTERAHSRCRSRESGPPSPFSPEIAKSAINQSSPEPAPRSASPRAVVSDIVRRASAYSPSPTHDVRTPTPPIPQHVSVSSRRQNDDIKEETNGLFCQARTVVMHALEGVLVSFSDRPAVDRDPATEIVPAGHRSSLFLETINDVFRESETDVEHHQHATYGGSENSSSEDDPEEEDEIIGVIENEVIAEEESVHSLAGCIEGAGTEALTSVIKRSHDKTIFEGAVVPHDKAHESVTERVLSVEELHKDSSGKLVHDASSKSLHKVDKSGENSGEQIHGMGHHYSSIIPVYHNHPLALEDKIISQNLSAISIKPDVHSKVPSAFSASSRNSFRNIFRPDMTYCQGSAKCLKDTLVKQLSHPEHSEHDYVYGVLDQPHEDITAHHSDEELVEQDETEGVCYLPLGKAYRAHQVVDDVVREEQESSEGTGDENDTEVPGTSHDSKDIPAGGDCKSPNEEEVEPTLPSSRISNRSIRSAKSRDIKNLQSKPCSDEDVLPSSQPRDPIKVVPNFESTSIEERKASMNAVTSRSVMGAVIDRLSSIFTRKYSTKIHSESTEGQTKSATVTTPQNKDQEIETDDKTNLDENHEAKVDNLLKSELLDTKVADNDMKPGSVAPRESSLKASDRSPVDKKQVVDDKARDTRMPSEGKVEAKEDVTSEATTESKSEKQERILTSAKTMQTAHQLPADQEIPVPENTKKMEIATKTDVKEETKEQIVKSDAGLSKVDDKSVTPTEQTQPRRSKTKVDDSKGEAGVNEKKSSLGEKGKERGGKKKTRPTSYSGAKGFSVDKSGTLKPYSSLTAPLPTAARSSTSGFKRRSQKLSSPFSPNRKQSTPSPYSSKCPSRQERVQQEVPAEKKSLSQSKTQIGTFMSDIVTQRSQISKPPSSRSVRLIKVSPAPSMSSSRRRSEKLGSSSVGQLISSKGSGGSVRLINVSPAVSTTTGPRRSTRYSDGVQSFSDTKVKSSMSAKSSSTSNKERMVLAGKPLSLQSRKSSCQAQSHAAVLPVHRMGNQDGCNVNSSANQIKIKTSSKESFVVVEIETDTQPAREKPTESNESSGLTEITSEQRELTLVDSHKDSTVGKWQEHRVLDGGSTDSSKEYRQVKTDKASVEIATDAQGSVSPEGETHHPQKLTEGISPEKGSDVERHSSSHPDVSSKFQSQMSASASPGDQGTTGPRRSRNIISAVIERLSRIFSRDESLNRNGVGESQRDESPPRALSEGTVRPSRESGTARHGQSAGVLSLKMSGGTKSGNRLRLVKSEGKELPSSPYSGRSKSGVSLPVPPNSEVSNVSVVLQAEPETAAQTTSTHSGGPTRPISSTKQPEPGSNHLPPVEDVEKRHQPGTASPEPVVSPEESTD